MNRPGLQFYAEPIGERPAGDLAPRLNEIYVLCKDGTVQSVFDSAAVIPWTLVDLDNSWYYYVNDRFWRCLVRYHATSENPPDGRSGRTSPEIDRTLERLRNVIKNATLEQYQGTQFEEIARNLNPQLAACTNIVNDPVQTDAMTKFSRGQLSYAEMRALCG